MISILLVDDDEVELAGREIILRRLGLEVRATAWGPLAADRADLTGVTVAVVVVRRDTDRWDRYQVLRSMGDLRSVLGPQVRIVGLLEAGEALDPVIGLRLVAAGVGEVLALDRVRSGRDLLGVVSGARRGPSPAPSPSERFAARIGSRCHPDRVVDRVLEMAEDDPSFLRAFDPGVQQNECGLSRRRAHTLRVRVAELGDLHPAPGRSMGGPVRDRSLPRWAEVVDFVNRCRGHWPEDDATGPPTGDRRPLVTVGGRRP